MVKYIHDHVTIGNGFAALSAIADPKVNLAIARNIISADLTEYLDGIDWHIHFKSDWDAAPPPMGREGLCNFNCASCPLEPSNGERLSIKPADFGIFDVADTEAVIRSQLQKFPADGRKALEDTIIAAVKGFAIATKSKTVRADLIAKYPVGSSAWHQDGNLWMRGLITFKGPGTFWRLNSSVPEEEWTNNVRLDSQGRRTNGYGLFGTFMEQAFQIETGHMMLFKGGLGSDRPLIHAEPTHPITKDPRAMRLLLTIDAV